MEMACRCFKQLASRHIVLARQLPAEVGLPSPSTVAVPLGRGRELERGSPDRACQDDCNYWEATGSHRCCLLKSSSRLMISWPWQLSQEGLLCLC